MTSITPLIEPKIKEWIVKSMESEMYASMLYRYIANQLQRLGYFGSQKYYLAESADELIHYQILCGFLNDMGCDIPSVAVPAINNPITGIGDALDLQYNAELQLMRQYEAFYAEAVSLEDFVTSTFIIKFLKIQRKSVGVAGDLIARLNINRCTGYEFDEWLGEK